ncbi:glycosyltransferase [Novosphingobium sp. TH158]|uniref:glycosyltransferase n=1 Tax=Novosphingobium sp. TH158 TaxID=2067455 RepID=UPI000C7AFB4A|nr:glycosyltransferase [Novosphingobium sp. TH158]PLK24408.1 glycosyl transferase family 1 [Novosphingobium sp. TH158]
MRLLFAHDNRFIRLGDDVWSAGQFGAEGWQRYLDHASRMTVVAREQLMPDQPLDQLARSSRDRVAFHFFRDLSNLRGLLLRRSAALDEMRTLVRAHDAVVARMPSEIGHLAVAAARIERKRCWVEIVGCPSESLRHHGGLRARFYAPLAAARLRAVSRRAEHASYVTADFLQRRYPTGATNVLSVSDVLLPASDIRVLQDRLVRIAAQPADAPLKIGMIGALQNKNKGLQVLLHALARVRDRMPPVRLRVVGQGDLDAWRNVAQSLGLGDLTVFEGNIAQPADVFGWLRSIDLYVQPSLTEGLPRALIEAMCQACPAIGSSAGGIPELLPGPDLVAPGNANALGELLARRVADPSWMARSAQRNWEKAQSFETSVLEPVRQAFWQRFLAGA